MIEDLLQIVKCPNCSSYLNINNDMIICFNCSFKKSKNSVIKYVDGKYHSNWGLQWNEFSKIQLDSFNLTDESEKRLFIQSGLHPNDIKEKIILEVGSGNGRFTEVLLKYKARVITLDYSRAIEANLNNNSGKGDVVFIQGDIFNMPFKAESFDIVLCYGVIQHTGNNFKAMQALMPFVKKNGILTLDVYSNKLKFYNPFIYFLRPIFLFFRISDERRLNIIKKIVNFLFPIQLYILSKIKNKKYLKIIKYLINRSPNSVYGINLFLDGKISKELAYQWSIMDTFDSYGGKFDHPISMKTFNTYLTNLSAKYKFEIIRLSESGQGNYGILKKK